MKSELTELELRADHEARIGRQELPPLQQPLDNIDEIKHALDDPWLPFDSAPEDVPLLWCFMYTKESNCIEYVANTKIFVTRLLAAYGERLLLRNFTRCCWQHLPPPPKEQK